MKELEVLHLIANVCSLLSAIALIAVIHRFPKADTLYRQFLKGEFTDEKGATDDGASQEATAE